MTKCQQCGTTLYPAGAESCSLCGYVLAGGGEPEHPYDKHRRRLLENHREILDGRIPSGNPAPQPRIKSRGYLNLLMLQAGISPFEKLSVPKISGTFYWYSPQKIFLNQVFDPSEPSSGLPTLVPNIARFAGLKEAVKEVIGLYPRDSRDRRPFWTEEVVVHARNEWVHQFPETLAGAVIPGSSALAQAIPPLFERSPYKESAAIGSRGVLGAIGKIWSAVQDLEIQYSTTAISFEDKAQRVQFPDELLAHKRGCCLDFACLYASILEREKLNPLILGLQTSKGAHVALGVWLHNRQTRRAVIRDAELIHQERASLVVFDSTSSPTFKEAQIQADVAIRKGFQWAIDIKACRSRGIRPIPTTSSWEI